MRKLIFLLGFIFWVSGNSFGQDIQYSQFYANPFHINPAFAGSTSESRVGVNFRNQWPSLDQSFIAYTAYADHFFEDISSGVGIVFSGAKESFTQSQQYEIGLVYSYRLQLGDKNFVQFGAQASYAGRESMFDKVILGSQLNIDNGEYYGSAGDLFEGDSKLSSFDANAGILFYGEKYWIGGAAFHLLEPPISYIEPDLYNLPVRYGVHGGYRIDLAPGNINDFFNNTDQERSLAFAFNYKTQGLYSQLDLGTEFYFQPLILGLWYRGLPTKYELPNNESLIALIGFSLRSGLEFGYSFDFSISKMGQSVSGGAHEISFRYVFVPRNGRKRRYAPLPTFRF